MRPQGKASAVKQKDRGTALLAETSLPSELIRWSQQSLRAHAAHVAAHQLTLQLWAASFCVCFWAAASFHEHQPNPAGRPRNLTNNSDRESVGSFPNAGQNKNKKNNLLSECLN